MPATEHASALHTTLPMEELIGLFAGEIRDLIEYDSFEYEDRATSTHVFIGVPKLHKCHYKIRLAGTEFGQITLTRARPFEDSELGTIERGLSALAIHLNNARSFQAELGEEALIGLKADRRHSSSSAA